MKWIDSVSEFFPSMAAGGGGGAFLPAKPKLLEIT